MALHVKSDIGPSFFGIIRHVVTTVMLQNEVPKQRYKVMSQRIEYLDMVVIALICLICP